MSALSEGLPPEELDAGAGVALPDKEVLSILDLFTDIDLAIDGAAPVDLAVGRRQPQPQPRL